MNKRNLNKVKKIHNSMDSLKLNLPKKFKKLILDFLRVYKALYDFFIYFYLFLILIANVK